MDQAWTNEAILLQWRTLREALLTQAQVIILTQACRQAYITNLPLHRLIDDPHHLRNQTQSSNPGI